jgi:uncharacterized protein YjiS (DUF1127 family)
MIDFLARAIRAIESRRRLAEMDDRMLSDIGISRLDALAEAGRRPWDVTPARRPARPALRLVASGRPAPGCVTAR